MPCALHPALPKSSQLSKRGTSHTQAEATHFVALLRVCAKNKDLRQGTLVHDGILSRGLLDTCADALVDMYVKCGELGKAQELFDLHKSKDVFAWTALMSGYVSKGQGQDALALFKQMQAEGISPDAVTYSCLLKACGSIRAADQGARIHEEIAKRGLLGNDVVLGNGIVDMYVKCGALTKARRLLEELTVRNVVSWNILISGYAQQGEGAQALNCFEQMQHEGISPDSVTFMCILKACGSAGAVDKGESFHEDIAKQGSLGHNVMLGTALVDMYAKCGLLVKAQRVLLQLSERNVISWNALISGHVRHSEGAQALTCYEKMQHEGIAPNAVTFICVLKACGSIGAADVGEKIHIAISKQGLLGSDLILGNAVVDMYAKCGTLERAQRVLEELPVRDVISWNALITGYSQQRAGGKALKCFEEMDREGISPNAVTFICILKACGSLRTLEKGESIHAQIAYEGLLRNDIAVGNALVDMYVKCNALSKAREVLEELSIRNVLSWNALIAGYIDQGDGEEALSCFERMQQEGLSPDMVTFGFVLKACGSIGATDRGDRVHREISKQGLLGNNVELGTSVVDMYAKCGALTKARQVLGELPSRDVISWNALISGYAQHCKSAEALSCLEQMQQEGLSPDAASFSCVLNACSRSSLAEDAQMHFMTMSSKYHMNPAVEHYTSMINLFGRDGQLDRAVGLIGEMASSTSSSSAVWSALLGACWNWGDVKLGRWAFERALQVDSNDASLYVLMGNICKAAGMVEDAENIELFRVANEVWEKPSWVDRAGKSVAHENPSHVFELSDPLAAICG